MSLHKLGTTIPVAGDYRKRWDTLRISSFSLGGSRRHVCTGDSQKRLKNKRESNITLPSTVSPREAQQGGGITIERLIEKD